MKKSSFSATNLSTVIIFLLITASTASATQDVPSNQLIEVHSLNRYMENTTDFDEVDDTRNFTSEALFSASEIRLNRDLTKEELRNIVRVKSSAETFNFLRFRPYRGLLTDLFYRYRDIEDAQITHFFAPSEFNNVTLEEYGIALQKDYNVDSTNVLLRGSYKRSKREGIIEFLPETTEDINSIEVNVAFANDGFTLFPTYVYQDIDPDISDPPERHRHIGAVGFTYKTSDEPQTAQDIKAVKEDPRPLGAIDNILDRRFDIRHIDTYGGLVYDREKFGDTSVTKKDLYIGVVGHFGNPNSTIPTQNPFHIALQPGLFTSEVEGSPSQDNNQYRTTLIFAWDALRHPGELVFVVPFRHDLSVKGPNNYENWKIGGELTYRLAKHRGVPEMSASVRYAHQNFYNLDKELDLWGVELNLKF